MKKLSITMISNAMSHHQLPFCEYMASKEDVSFQYIATKPIAIDRLQMGYEDLNKSGEYILRAYESEEQYRLALKLAKESDFVIYGSAPYKFIRSRVWKRKWTFIYSERIFKNGWKDKKLLKKILIYGSYFGIVPHKALALLCASGYSARDFKKFGLDTKKMYRWGYFPPNTKANYEQLVFSKEKNTIVWVARMIPWKHPELAIELAEKLKEEQVPFHLTMVGDGPMFQEISEMVCKKNLSSYVTLTGAQPKDRVREIMEQSEILLATSDYGEGWGAVINEGMNSACAVIASQAMGATPFLIRDTVNGMSFQSGDSKELYEKVLTLLQDDEKRIRIQKNAFETIEQEWNGMNAGEKLIYLCKQFQAGNIGFAYPDGVCSRADASV